MKTCKRLIDYIQIINAEGDVRACGWNYDNLIGNLQAEDFDTILNSDQAKKLRRMIAEGDYSRCPSDNCPYISNGNMDEILVEYDEDTIRYPESLLLAYEGKCNYHCTCCTSYQHMETTKANDYEALYDQLEGKIRKVLPFVKHIGANGRGELFASPRIMKLLSEWRPVAPTEDISVSLETNGSLFNEKNWRKIENLGHYHLSVSITVMSLQEDIYRYLSGTNLPVANIIDNLKYVKSLREKNIINKLTLATVLQEANFREMPEFARRCLDEFGADCVRIRPIFPGGYLPEEIQWYMDVRNPHHPYYDMYKKIMEDPIFNDPRVLLWSNDIPSALGRFPLKNDIDRLSSEIKNRDRILEQIKSIMGDENLPKRIEKRLHGRSLAIYGLGALGKTAVLALKDQIDIDKIFDRCKDTDSFHNIPVFETEKVKEFTGLIIITPYGRYEEMKKELIEVGFTGEILKLEEVL